MFILAGLHEPDLSRELLSSRGYGKEEGMTIFISEAVSSIIQIFLFSLIPFFWWLITARKNCGFFGWLGLKKINRERFPKLLFGMAVTVLGFWLAGQFSLYALKDVPTAASAFAGLKMKGIPAVIIYAFFHTALSEEILFRGFLLKRIAAKFGFQAGNAVQALLFGLLHGAMFVAGAGYLKAFLLILFTGAIAWVMGYINEKKAEGSILPGWVIHGAANLLSGLAELF